jgi:hypothetical protein
MTLVLDSGALVALERGDRAMWKRLKDAHSRGVEPVCHGGIVGQAWRGRGPRQALLSKALRGIDVRPLDETLGRAAGELMARSRTTDVVDAALVMLALDGDVIATSDPADMVRLVAACGRDVDVVTT